MFTRVNSQLLNPVNANGHVQRLVCSALVWQPADHHKPEATAFTNALLTLFYADVCEALSPKVSQHSHAIVSSSST